MITKHRSILITGIIGVLATLFVGWGEFLLHIHNCDLMDLPSYSLKVYKESKHLVLGHFLTIMASPLYLAGYWHVYQMLNPKKNSGATLLCLIAGYGSVMGGIWVGSRLMVILMAQAHESLPDLSLLIRNYENYYEDLLQVTRVTTLIFSLGVMILVSFRQTFYPRWFILFSPIMPLVIIFLLFFTLPNVGLFMAPIAMNMAYFVFFSLSTIICISSKQRL